MSPSQDAGCVGRFSVDLLKVALGSRNIESTAHKGHIGEYRCLHFCPTRKGIFGPRLK